MPPSPARDSSLVFFMRASLQKVGNKYLAPCRTKGYVGSKVVKFYIFRICY